MIPVYALRQFFSADGGRGKDKGRHMKKIKAVVLGCGDRGNVYASYSIDHPDEMEIVSVVDVDPVALKTTGDKYGIPEEYRFKNIDDFLAAGIKCDTVINATMDSDHYSTAKKLILNGYDQLLEKPIVNNEKELYRLKKFAEEKNVSLIICHVLRYTPFYKTVKTLLNEGQIGKIQTLEMNEHVELVHFADSFVRGKWSDEKTCGSGLLLQKCCHDLDLMCWLNNFSLPKRVSSFGSRSYFLPENAPEGATEFCYNCPNNATCLYSAQKIHLDLDWFYFQTWRGIGKPLSEITRQDKEEYLKVSDYGKCVYTLKRNLVDRQNVNVEFSDGSVGSFTVVGGCSRWGRYLHIIGSKGEISGKLEDNKIILTRKVRENGGFDSITEVIDLSDKIPADASHSNGDMSLMKEYIQFLNGDKSSVSLTTIDDSVSGHLCVYAAEKSRKEGKTVKLNL